MRPFDGETAIAVTLLACPLNGRKHLAVQAKRLYRHAAHTGVYRIRHNSRLRHLGMGRRYAGTNVLILVHDLHIRIITTDGELLRVENGFISGFFNTASGRSLNNGFSSGFLNTGVPSSLEPGLAGELSGLFNTGSLMSGLFNIDRL
jgi:hypothetical protein